MTRSDALEALTTHVRIVGKSSHPLLVVPAKIIVVPSCNCKEVKVLHAQGQHTSASCVGKGFQSPHLDQMGNLGLRISHHGSVQPHEARSYKHTSRYRTGGDID